MNRTFTFHVPVDAPNRDVAWEEFWRMVREGEPGFDEVEVECSPSLDDDLGLGRIQPEVVGSVPASSLPDDLCPFCGVRTSGSSRCPNLDCPSNLPEDRACPSCGSDVEGRYCTNPDCEWYTPPSAGLTDQEALDQLALLLSSELWPGASGMEDVEFIVRSTGRDTNQPDAPLWPRH